ncbi:MAG TPA: malonyl-CoA decarboxylase [Aliidongia sp.]|uniref:malonyl-CoA decarboxylase n=1 Tax=Aliidongia sp. TaxID=1914230 RepID=UPI002DDCEEAE|nr:malonyl-CoA decarboxylase [Aliidongia sp.]HEV2673929.1 malonyl-CoA decarboxylase [Aliidongia sp.]
MSASWFDRLLSSIADRGRAWVKIPTGVPPLEQAVQLSRSLISERGEASGAALARALLESLGTLGETDRLAYYRLVAADFAPDPEPLKRAAEAYLAAPSPATAMVLGEVAEPPRQELLRRINMAPGGTGTLVHMRENLLPLLREHPDLAPLDGDLRHLLGSWFNRGFLELRRIDWHQTPAAILEKLIRYEAVHEIKGWPDLRRRLAPDRRCFAFFHPALADEPLIFVEVALVNGLSQAVQPLLEQGEVDASKAPDTAIFYSISNCQKGLRGISFGNFLIKQVVEELKAETPSLVQFATLSPVPGFRRWLDAKFSGGAKHLLTAEERVPIAALADIKGAKGAFRRLLDAPGWHEDAATEAALRAPLLRLAAEYLTSSNEGKGPTDPVARFHLGNGARLERVNWLANIAPRGFKESYGVMVNYLYDLDRIEANHEAFVRHGTVAHSDAVEALVAQGVRRNGVTSLLGFSGRRNAS